MRRVVMLLLIVSACDSSPSTGGLKHVPAIAQSDGGEAPVDGGAPDDAGLEPDGGATLAETCAAAGCALGLCELLDGGVACGVSCGSPCADAGLCATSPCTSDAGWSSAYCTPGTTGLTWSTSSACDDPTDLCSTGNTCQVGACTGGTTKSCPTDSCHGACVPATGACVVHSGASCDDGNACTTGDTCKGDGTCAGTKSGTPVHRYSDPAACDWYFSGNPGAGWNDDGVAFRSAPGGGVTVAQLFDNTSLGRPLTTNPGAWSSVGSFPVEEAEVVTAFSSVQLGAEKLVRYRFIAASSCQVSGWARYFSTINAAEEPAGAAVSDTPPGVGTVDTDIWVCPP